MSSFEYLMLVAAFSIVTALFALLVVGLYLKNHLYAMGCSLFRIYWSVCSVNDICALRGYLRDYLEPKVLNFYEDRVEWPFGKDFKNNAVDCTYRPDQITRANSSIG